MMRNHLLPLSSSSRSFLFLKALTSSSSQSCPFNSQIGRCYGSEAQEKTRAPSTAEEFKRVAEEKLKQEASQTLEKATSSDGKPESVKKKVNAS